MPVIPAKKPKDRRLYLREHAYNTQIKSIRSPIEQADDAPQDALRSGRSYSPATGYRWPLHAHRLLPHGD
jgi:hypothetical protein